MKFKDILKIGASVIGTANPAIGAAIGIVNKFLPDDKKLPETAANHQVQSALETLTPEQRESIYLKELDIELKELETFAEIQGVLAAADATGSSTRPFIALMMAWIITLTVTPVAWAYAYGLVAGEAELMTSIGNSYMVLLGIIGAPILIVRQYFGCRTKEKQSRYAAAKDQPVQSVGMLASIAAAISGK